MSEANERAISVQRRNRASNLSDLERCHNISKLIKIKPIQGKILIRKEDTQLDKEIKRALSSIKQSTSHFRRHNHTHKHIAHQEHGNNQSFNITFYNFSEQCEASKYRRSRSKSNQRCSTRLEKTCNISPIPHSLYDRSQVMENSFDFSEFERQLKNLTKNRMKKIHYKLNKSNDMYSDQGVIKKEWHEIVQIANQNFLIQKFKKEELPVLLETARKRFQSREESKEVNEMHSTQYRVVKKIDDIFVKRNEYLKNLTDQYIKNKDTSQRAPKIVKEQARLSRYLTKELVSLGYPLSYN